MEDPGRTWTVSRYHGENDDGLFNHANIKRTVKSTMEDLKVAYNLLYR